MNECTTLLMGIVDTDSMLCLLHFVVRVLTQRSSELVVPVLGWRVGLSASSAAVPGKSHSLLSSALTMLVLGFG